MTATNAGPLMGIGLLFLAVAYWTIVCGNERLVRITGCFAQAVFACAAVLVVIMPLPTSEYARRPQTDVGRYADAISRSIGVRVADRYKELAHAAVNPADQR